jgi:hypothetical protein
MNAVLNICLEWCVYVSGQSYYEYDVYISQDILTRNMVPMYFFRQPDQQCRVYTSQDSLSKNEDMFTVQSPRNSGSTYF